MEELLSSTLLSITLVAVLDTLVSKTKNGLVVKKVIALISTTLIIIPIIKITTNINFDSVTTFNSEYYTNYLINLEMNSLKNDIKTRLTSEGYNVEKIEIVTSNDENPFVVEKVLVNLKISVITENNEHIHIVENAKKLIEDYLKNDKVEVEIET